MDEGRIEQRLKREIKKRGGKTLKFTSPGWAGAPDRLVLLPGARIIFVELKAPRKKLEPLQAKRADELRALDFPVYKIDSELAIESFIAEVFHREV